MRASLKEFWRKQTPVLRLVIAAIFATLCFLWVLNWITLPSKAYLQGQQQKHAQLLIDYQLIERVDFDLLTSQPAQLDLLASISAAADVVNIELSRIVPNAESQSVRVDILNARNADLVHFLALVDEAGIIVRTASVQKTESIGYVTARMVLFSG